MTAVVERADVAVVGGGLAGITAALRLADAGRQVVLLESKPRLGGLTTSFTRDSSVGPLTVDTGQHVFLRCCTSYRRLLERLGVAEQATLQRRLDIPVLRPADGRRARLRRDPLPVLGATPLHLARALLGYRLLSVPERLACSRALQALAVVDPASAAADQRSFGAWLAEHGQSPAAIEAVWELIGIATLNARAADASLALAATVFQLGLLSSAGAADVGWAAVPLSELHGRAAERALTRAEVSLRLRQRVTGLQADPSGWWTVQISDQQMQAAAVVVATEPAVAERLLPPGAGTLPAGWSERLGATPIINAHFVFDRRVLGEPLVALPGSALQFLFDRTASSGLTHRRPGAQHVVASISAADGFVGEPVSVLRTQLSAALERALPHARSARLLDFFVTREPHATWRQAPGQAAHRPPAATRLPGLVVAGAHTDTGWPATMEGAVRSGDAAAAALLGTGRRTATSPSYPPPSSEDAAA